MKRYRVITKENETIKRVDKDGTVITDTFVRTRVYDNMGIGYEMEDVTNLIKCETKLGREVIIKEM